MHPQHHTRRYPRTILSTRRISLTIDTAYNLDEPLEIEEKMAERRIIKSKHIARNMLNGYGGHLDKGTNVRFSQKP